MAMEVGGEYLALARKYRPQNFEDVVGQEHVLNALMHSLDSERIHHAYLLTGTRGIGKTTIARIFAKALECRKGVSSHPCGVCDACTAISAGTFPEVIEIDAASQTKVDDTREMLDRAQYQPVDARYKIFIIDEVHMLTTNSFNALLKTLEEPPEYVKFILATTDPHKIPTTVLSRCLQFQLRALNVDEIAGRIHHICSIENIAADSEAVLAIARAARGSMRDALSLCDQGIALGHGKLETATVVAMLGTVGDALVSDILGLLATKDSATPALNNAGAGNATGTAADLATLLTRIRQKSPNYKQLLDELVLVFHDLALYQFLGSGSPLEVFSFSNSMLAQFAPAFTPEQLQLYYQIVLEGVQEYGFASDGRSAFEMTLLRLLAFSPERKKKLFRGENPAGRDLSAAILDGLVGQVRSQTAPAQALGPQGAQSVAQTAPLAPSPFVPQGTPAPQVAAATAAIVPAPASQQSAQQSSNAQWQQELGDLRAMMGNK